MDKMLQRLLDEAEIRRVVDGIDSSVDAKDWDRCLTYFTPEIEVDFVSLAGGEPARIPAAQLVGSWQQNLYQDKHTQHMRTNHEIEITENNAVCISKGYAFNRLERKNGDALWEVWGIYRHTLERTGEGEWKVSGMTLTVTHARGNEMVRDYLPTAD
ncbi:MAG: nuclear transport factor 2 family protein [Armatimonadota bacterium]